jgi:hypothetical protein
MKTAVTSPRQVHRERSKPVGAKARARVFQDFRTGVYLSLVLAAAGVAFEQTPPGEWFQKTTYHRLQRLLVPNERFPIQLIDIIKLPKDEHQATPRKTLESLIGAVAEQNPKVIGVDIDFSPEGGNFIEPQDPDFFNHCLDITQHRVPLFLGILRTAAKPPDEWLGLPEYRDLAAAILVPTDGTRSVTRSFGAYRGLTMGAALAQGFEKEPASGNWLLASESERRVKGLYVKEFPVDYSLLPKLNEDAIRMCPPFDDASIRKFIRERRGEITEKMVLIGDVTGKNDNQCLGESKHDADCQDVFPNPTKPESEAIRGVLLHASAAYTTVNSPLFDIREPWRTGADIFLAWILLGSILLVRLASDINASHLLYLLTGGAVVLVVALGLLVNHSHVLWDGFLLVAIVLVLHAIGEEPFERAWEWLKKWLHAKEDHPECSAEHLRKS